MFLNVNEATEGMMKKLLHYGQTWSQTHVFYMPKQIFISWATKENVWEYLIQQSKSK